MSDTEETVAIQVFLTDGGRGDAGYKGLAGDCSVRALALALGDSYSSVYSELWHIKGEIRAEARTQARKDRYRGSPRDGVPKDVIERFLARRKWVWVPLQQIGDPKRTHLRFDELPEAAIMARAVLQLSKHVVCVRHGVVFDNHDPSRDGTRLVYGYWAEETVLRALGEIPLRFPGTAT